MLELEHVEKAFEGPAGPVPVLQRVSLTFEDGGTYAVMGRSGSGKSTLLSVLGLLERPDAGTYLVDGIDSASLGDGEASALRGKSFGFVFQRFYLIAHLTAFQNVELGLEQADGGVPRKLRRARVLEALGSVGLGDRADHRPAQLSGGEQQRVALARALVKRPRYLLADEPSGALDEETAGRVVELLVTASTAAGATVIVATHDHEVASALAHVIHLERGGVGAP